MGGVEMYFRGDVLKDFLGWESLVLSVALPIEAAGGGGEEGPRTVHWERSDSVPAAVAKWSAEGDGEEELGGFNDDGGFLAKV